MISRQQIVWEARSWLGTPWQHQAYLKGVATDCMGLVGGVALALGIEGATDWRDDPRYHCYGETPDPVVLLEGCDKFLKRITLLEAREGDILVMAFERHPQHFGIVSQVNPMYLVHAYSSVGRVVENGIRMARVRVLRAYSYRGIL